MTWLLESSIDETTFTARAEGEFLIIEIQAFLHSANKSIFTHADQFFSHALSKLSLFSENEVTKIHQPYKWTLHLFFLLKKHTRARARALSINFYRSI